MEKMEEKKERDIEKEIEELTKYFLENFADEIKGQLGTSDDSTNYSLHIFIYRNGNIVLDLIEEGNYDYIEKIDIDLGRVSIYDDYDLDEAYKRLGNRFDDEVTEEAYVFFKENFDFEEYIKDSIESQLTNEEIDKLYDMLITEQ